MPAGPSIPLFPSSSPLYKLTIRQSVRDQVIQTTLDRPLAVKWFRAQSLRIDEKFDNAENYVFYCLLAALANGGWRLARDNIDAVLGKLEPLYRRQIDTIIE